MKKMKKILKWIKKHPTKTMLTLIISLVGIGTFGVNMNFFGHCVFMAVYLFGLTVIFLGEDW